MCMCIDYCGAQPKVMLGNDVAVLTQNTMHVHAHVHVHVHGHVYVHVHVHTDDPRHVRTPCRSGAFRAPPPCMARALHQPQVINPSRTQSAGAHFDAP